MAFIQKFIGLLGNKEPQYLAQQCPKILNLAQHTWKWAAFHDWQWSGETADVPLPFPHQMIEYGQDFLFKKALMY